MQCIVRIGPVAIGLSGGCVGVWSRAGSIDVFRRPYLGSFVRVWNRGAWIGLVPPRIRFQRF